ncbi:MAG: hypothetical protein EP330_27335 [Deltaproteobacteria bacterium]|nr:MAG: hypothetical protein EP330_27335 [Deltaproteobacteria bacterium]
MASEDTLQYVALWVASATYTLDQIHDMTVELLEAEGDDAEEAGPLIEAAIRAQIAKELTWGEEPTTVDRLLAAFQDLVDAKIEVFEAELGSPLQAYNEVRQVLKDEHEDPLHLQGFVFYTDVGLEAAQDEGKLGLWYGGWGFSPAELVRISLLAALVEHGLDQFDEGPGCVTVHLGPWRRRGWANGSLRD